MNAHLEPCLVCCQEDEIPAQLREFVLELRREYPATRLAPIARGLPPGLPAGLGQCWNCRGTQQVRGPQVGPR